MNPVITLTWSTDDTREKLELQPTDTGWHRQRAHTTTTGWHQTTEERIDHPTLRITPNWQTDDPLVAYFPEPAAAILAHPDGLRYRATRSQTCQPIDATGLTHLCHRHGPPTLRPLSDTPFERTAFEPGRPITTNTTHSLATLLESITHSPLLLTAQPAPSNDGETHD